MEDMDDERAATLQSFMDISGCDDPSTAINVLEATGWALEDAVNLHFASGNEPAGGGGAAGAGGAAGGGDQLPPQLPPLEEDEVRAPLPVMRDRLYGDGMGMHGVAPRPARYGPPDPGPAHMTAFEDFNPDAGSSGAGGSNSQRLSEMFKLPPGLRFEGDFEAAKECAAQKGRWLLVNVQSQDEFASLRLNRDTWSQPLVQDMLRETLIFWQVNNASQAGAALVGAYQLDGLPAVFIVDPVTGAKLWERTGYVSADALIEELVPFMDAGPNDPGASALAQRFHEQAAKRRLKAAGPSGGTPMTEDDELALALAMSAEGVPGAAAAGAAAGAGAGGAVQSDDLDEDAIWREIQRRQQEDDAAKAAGASSGAPAAAPAAAAAAARQSTPPPPGGAPRSSPAPAAAASPAVVDAASLQAAAAARLPPEPAEGAPGSCRVAFRLPDGTRVQRRFNTSDTVAALQDYCASVSSEAAHMAGSFALSEPRPGSTPLDPAATIEAAGVANAMLVLRPT